MLREPERASSYRGDREKFSKEVPLGERENDRTFPPVLVVIRESAVQMFAFLGSDMLDVFEWIL